MHVMRSSGRSQRLVIVIYALICAIVVWHPGSCRWVTSRSVVVIGMSYGCCSCMSVRNSGYAAQHTFLSNCTPVAGTLTVHPWAIQTTVHGQEGHPNGSRVESSPPVCLGMPALASIGRWNTASGVPKCGPIMGFIAIAIGCCTCTACG